MSLTQDHHSYSKMLPGAYLYETYRKKKKKFQCAITNSWLKNIYFGENINGSSWEKFWKLWARQSGADGENPEIHILYLILHRKFREQGFNLPSVVHPCKDLERGDSQLVCKELMSLLPVSASATEHAQKPKTNGSRLLPCSHIYNWPKILLLLTMHHLWLTEEALCFRLPSVQMLKIHRKPAVRRWEMYLHRLVMHVAWLNHANQAETSRIRPHEGSGVHGHSVCVCGWSSASPQQQAPLSVAAKGVDYSFE